MARQRRRNRGQPTPTWMLLYVRDKGICGLCDESVSPDEASAEHLVPLSRGGSHSLNNCYLAHKTCNSAKGNRLPTTEEWAKQYRRLGWRYRRLDDVAIFK